MKALTFQGIESVQVEDVREPSIEQPTDVLVRVELSAICGSDLHVYHGREKGLDAGTVMGHEFVGEVLEKGKEVEKLRAGDRVVSPFTVSCGRCHFCTIGLTARCTSSALFGWVENGKGLQGAQAELVRVPLADSTLVKIPEGARTEEALFAGDILSTGFFAADAAHVHRHDVVAVIGCGPVGIMAIVAALELRAGLVFGIDFVPERCELARSFGAHPIVAGKSVPMQAVKDVTEGRGADVVIEAVGSPSATRLAYDLVRPGGRISAPGVHTEPQFSFSPGEAYDKNLTYCAGRCSARHLMERLLPLIVSRKYDLSRIISHRLPLAEAARGYELFARRLENCTKVLLLP